MRLAYYYLASLLLAIAIIGAVAIGHQMMSRRPQVSVQTKPAMEVYVDLDKLMALHPDFGALQTLESTITELGKSHGPEIDAKSEQCDWEIPESDLRPRVAVPRWKLEDSAAQHADEALKQLQENQLGALSARAEASLKTMRESAESDLLLRARQILEDANQKTAEINQRYGDDFVELRVASLGYLNLVDEPGLEHVTDSEIRVRSVGPVKPKIGIDGNYITQGLGQIVDKLDSLDKQSSCELAGIDVDAQAKIGQLRASSTSKLEAVVRDFQSGQTRKIEARIKESQNEIMGDIQRFGESPVIGFPNQENTGAMAGRELKAKNPVFGPKLGNDLKHDEITWHTEAEALRERIRTDLICSLRNLAGKQGVKLVFVRKNDKIPDQTGKYGTLLKRSPWKFGIPVMRG